MEECVGNWEAVSALRHVRPFKYEELVGWSPLQVPAIKINTNGASKDNLGLARAGCVLRDHHNECLIGAAHNLEITTFVVA